MAPAQRRLCRQRVNSFRKPIGPESDHPAAVCGFQGMNVCSPVSVTANQRILSSSDAALMARMPIAFVHSFHGSSIQSCRNAPVDLANISFFELADRKVHRFGWRCCGSHVPTSAFHRDILAKQSAHPNGRRTLARSLAFAAFRGQCSESIPAPDPAKAKTVADDECGIQVRHTIRQILRSRRPDRQ